VDEYQNNGINPLIQFAHQWDSQVSLHVTPEEYQDLDINE